MGNRYRVGVDGDRPLVIARYRVDLRQHWLRRTPQIVAELERLTRLYQAQGDLDLLCWCAPQACHGEVVADFIGELAGEMLPYWTSPIQRVLITGSREASPRLLSIACRAVERAQANGWSIIVGEANGVDATVVETADRLGVPVEVWGARNTLRHQSNTGQNYTIPGSYEERDRLMVERADRCLAIWNGASRGTLATVAYARKLGLTVHLMTASEQRTDPAARQGQSLFRPFGQVTKE